MIFNPPTDLVPLFLRAGYLIPFQPKKVIKNTKSLDNDIQIIAALTNKNYTHDTSINYYSEGVILNLEDF